MTRQGRIADTILRNGRIWTGDPVQPWASELAIAGGRVLAVGSDLSHLGGPATQAIDLKGRMAMPGVHDVHLHLLMGGREELFYVRFPTSFGFEEIFAFLKERIAARPGEPVIGGAWGSEPGALIGTLDALEALDAATGDVPVILHDESHHNLWANTAAMKAAGVSRNTPDVQDGTIVRDRIGALTGLFLEEAKQLFKAFIRKVLPQTPERETKAAQAALAKLNRYGITAFHEAATSQVSLELLRSIDRAGQLTAWSVCSLPHAPFNGEDGAGEALWSEGELYRSEQIFPTFAKFFLDGVPPARTAAFVEPYLPTPDGAAGGHGDLYYSTEELAGLIEQAEMLGLASKMHCSGDAAVRQALDAIAMVRASRPGPAPRHHVAHASFIVPEDIARFAPLNAVADLCPVFWFPTSTSLACLDVLGEERTERFWPNKDLHDAGALLAAGSDWPVVPEPNPWIGIEGMITRANPAGDVPGVLGADQALDLETVLRIYTANAARAMGIEHLSGKLAPGMSADVAVLDRHLFEIAPGEIGRTEVVMTLFRGRVVYQA
jgi:hypothetical protein